MRTDRILLLGAFGQANPGDDALATAFVERLRGRDLVVASRDPNETAAAFDCATLPASPRAVAAAVASSRAIVVGGGTIFKALHASTNRNRLSLLRRSAAVLTVARARGVRSALVGVGADALVGREARRLSRHIVANADLLVLRDEESAAVLTAAGAPGPFRIGADPAWAGVTTAAASTPFDGPVVVVPSHLAGGRDLAARLGRSLEPLGQLGIRVQIQPWQGRVGDADHDLARAVAGHLPSAEILEPPLDLDSAVRRFATARVVVGLRFHALIASAAAGTPFVSVVHEPKLAGLARRLGQQAVPVHAPPAVLTLAVERALEGAAPDPGAIAAEVARAEDQFRLLDLLLDGGAAVDPTIGSDLALSTGGGAW
jgi:polysaccharide pyruvyl transferase WcaK-like protein